MPFNIAYHRSPGRTALKPPRKSSFKRVPAIDKCFDILDLIAGSQEPLGISEIAKNLSLNKSTVFNIVHTLIDLKVLEPGRTGNLTCGPRLHVLGKAAGSRSHLIHVVHPYLREISRASKFSAFLGVRFGLKIVIVDKVDAASGIKISSEVGIRMPILSGAGGKAVLSLLPDELVDEILAAAPLKQYTPNSILDPNRYKREVFAVRRDGIAYDREEYIEGLIALSVAIDAGSTDMQAAMWAVGLKAQASDEMLAELAEMLKRSADEINARLSST